MKDLGGKKNYFWKHPDGTTTPPEFSNTAWLRCLDLKINFWDGSMPNATPRVKCGTRKITSQKWKSHIKIQGMKPQFAEIQRWFLSGCDIQLKISAKWPKAIATRSWTGSPCCPFWRCEMVTLEFLVDCEIYRLCITTVLCPPAPVFVPSEHAHTLRCFIRSHLNGTVDKPWINRGQTVEPPFISVERMLIAVERLFFAVDRGTLKNL